ncbi:MAG: YggS family pyridoxal phosphate-dependent enzyme [Planctomycetota bacterium]
MDLAERLRSNLSRVKSEIAEACLRAGRAPDSVRLVAVTKYVDSAVTSALLAAGATDLGENRPQALVEKAEALAHLNPRWHLIGHLQRNKIRKVLPHVHLLHAGDSWRLLEAVNVAAGELSRPVDVLLEVNVSGDTSKHGFHPQDLTGLVPQLDNLGQVRVRGLMGMSGLESSPAEKQVEFARLRLLLERLQAVFPAARQWRELSMGMSDDFPAAIAEGSTMVRVGSALFAGI